MSLIELSDYTLAAVGSGNGIKNFYFSLSEGDACAVRTDTIDDAHTFLKALATLVKPETGVYRYMGEIIDFSDYRLMLPFKRKIGYIGQDSAMLSNRTVRENLLLGRSFFENSLTLTLDANATRFCELFNICDKLDLRPGELRSIELRMAIAIRELTKSFEVLLLERPEDFFGHNRFTLFSEILKDTLEHGHAIVFFSHDPDFIETFSNRKLLISGGTLVKIPAASK
jgi:ABC-type lipoprotein export system ATPase subunit